VEQMLYVRLMLSNERLVMLISCVVWQLLVLYKKLPHRKMTLSDTTNINSEHH